MSDYAETATLSVGPAGIDAEAQRLFRNAADASRPYLDPGENPPTWNVQPREIKETFTNIALAATNCRHYVHQQLAVINLSTTMRDEVKNAIFVNFAEHRV